MNALKAGAHDFLSKMGLSRLVPAVDRELREAASRQNEGPGNALLATLAYEHVCEVFTGFGEKGVSAEQVARDVVREVRAFQVSDAALGPHLADQWALPLALALWRRGGDASYTCTELTPHAITNFDVIERFLPVKFSTEVTAGGFAVKARATQLSVGQSLL